MILSPFFWTVLYFCLEHIIFTAFIGNNQNMYITTLALVFILLREILSEIAVVCCSVAQGSATF